MAMAKASILVAIFILLLTFLFRSNAGGIAVYWGQEDNEGSLADACNSGLYQYVMVAFLCDFGNFQTPTLNLAGHCDPPSGGCTGLSNDIGTCQSKGIKVLLSLGGGAGNYGFQSQDDARNLAQYLWDNYFGGQSNNRPLGGASLDGIDLDIEQGSSNYYSDLVGRLDQLGQQNGQQLTFSAAPQCPFPDQWDNPVLQTGLINLVWIQFYNNPECEYNSGDPSAFQNSWNQWTSSVPASQFFVGLPASPSAAGDGYVDPSDVNSGILPFIKQSGGKYGGIMLWDRGCDIQTGFSNQIIGNV
ncbi:hypothetical protein Drorol1_Dr00021120 [Drosera rotundifolia]